MKFGRPVFAVALLAATMLLSACGGDPEPKLAEPDPTPTTAPATPTPTPEPEPWEVKSKAGAEAFAHIWVDAQYEAQQGSSDHFRALSRGCELCDSIAEQYETVYDAGGSIKSSPIRVTESRVQDDGTPTRRTILLIYRSGRVKWIRKAGGAPEYFSGGPVRQLLEVTWESQGWHATKLIDFAGM